MDKYNKYKLIVESINNIEDSEIIKKSIPKEDHKYFDYLVKSLVINKLVSFKSFESILNEINNIKKEDEIKKIIDQYNITDYNQLACINRIIFPKFP
jgi:hypothetical protein